MAPSLLVLVVSSVWTALSLPLMMLGVAADGEGGGRCPPVLCGNVNISFPFRIVPEQATDTNCGAIGFQVQCSNNTPYLGFYGGDYWFQILNIFYGNGSMLVADIRKLQDFNISDPRGCHAPTSNSTTKLGYPFYNSPANKNLIIYNCTRGPPTAERERLVETVCHSNTFFRVAESFDKSGGYSSYFLAGCDAVFIPVLGGSGKVNASNYKELISDGFLLTWQLPSSPPLPPPTSGKFTPGANKSV
ncbi:hypothetical protein EJB05_31721, partial [Eragrostis curvula]